MLATTARCVVVGVQGPCFPTDDVAKVKLLVTSEVPIFKVFADDPTKEANEISAHMRSVMDDLVRLLSRFCCSRVTELLF